ncbi:serine hydrolase [Acrocarpospora corrugata]|nr:serine hydrolase [Acrocarpospora corrugata]
MAAATLALTACAPASTTVITTPAATPQHQSLPAGLSAVPTEQTEQVPPIDQAQLTKRLRSYLATHPGRTTASVADLLTGRVYHFRPEEQLPTASTAKVNILMALLRTTRWKSLPASVRKDADIMIRLSDNKAADRLWERIGRESGLTAANKAFKLKQTTAIGGRCVDLYCWGITKTTSPDQIRLLRLLARKDSPLKDRSTILKLMEQVAPEQKWGISAGACEGETVALKNGWLKHVANDQWAIVSAGLVANRFALSVFTEDNPTSESGITKVEAITEYLMTAFRTCPTD